MRYERQVWPRVERITITYPNAATSSGFLQVLEREGPEVVVGINGRKAAWVAGLARFLADQGVETVDDLRAWFQEDPAHTQDLMRVKGVKLKAANYLKLLVGIMDAVAIDTHLRNFLQSAGIATASDTEAGKVVAAAADLLTITPGDLDASIWRYQAG